MARFNWELEAEEFYLDGSLGKFSQEFQSPEYGFRDGDFTRIYTITLEAIGVTLGILQQRLDVLKGERAKLKARLAMRNRQIRDLRRALRK